MALTLPPQDIPPKSRELVPVAKGGRPAVRLGRRQARHMSQSILLEESGPPLVLRLLLLLIGVVVGAFVIWAGTARIEEVAVTFGQVIPSGRIQAIQHYEGGIVAEVPVQDGVVVAAGQVLLRLDPIGVESEREQMRARLVGLSLQAERLRAFAENRAPVFADVDPRYASLQADHKAMFAAQKASRSNQLSVIETQIEERRAEMAVLEAQMRTLDQQVMLVEEERGMRKQLYDKGFASKSALLTVTRDAVQATGELARVERQRQQAGQGLVEAQNRLAELDTKLREEAMGQLAAVSSETAQVIEALRKLEDRAQRLTLTAPTGGIVKGLSLTTIGAVATPGKTLMEVVPVGEKLQLEVQISTRDIGHVYEGQPVQIKFTAFDFSRYGTVAGTLVTISAATFQNERGEPYFRGLIDLERPYVGDHPERNRIIPGMTAQADILTGEKTLLEYLLKPIYRAMKQGFRER